MSLEKSCDAGTGECLNCLHHTEGAQRENCVDGYYGDAELKTCQRCVCNELGTNTTKEACDRVSGQCLLLRQCLRNTIWREILCNKCAGGYTGRAAIIGDDIVQKLQKQVFALISYSEDTGGASAYDADYDKMEETLKEEKQTLAEANISKEDIEEMSKKLARLKKQVIAVIENLGAIATRISNIT
ncbi:hypothetical protein GCK72_026034 [Caenorhabditis remanei]|uniref:Laminin EGF-like domain-containing protein n=1 Tax=Caenorhabditis remanei TaxID=31234 RepID=A0A6A5G3S3_CAERE|nr:hypothetical protein GCK72_026034 [Caenorhabditis remanei]KAF1749566.1 hypothetical protein GCK72_026034 [Caenorhabditis remanei]